MIRFRHLVALFVFASLLSSGLLLAAPARESAEQLSVAEIEAAYTRLIHELMSPFCPGRTIAACPSSQAAQLRVQIRMWLDEGHSEQWVEDELVRRWGDEVLGAPRLEGFGWAAWLAVPLALIVGSVVVASFVRRRRGRADEAVTGAEPRPSLDQERRRALEARLERELAAEEG